MMHISETLKEFWDNFTGCNFRKAQEELKEALHESQTTLKSTKKWQEDTNTRLKADDVRRAKQEAASEHS
jgi:hypothetical protein